MTRRPFRAALPSLLLAAASAFLGCFDGGGTETGNAGLASGVSGSVHDGGGTETGNADVALVSLRYTASGAESSVVRTARTDARGRYAFEDVEPGRYAVAVPGGGETPLSALATRLTVAKDEKKVVDLTVRNSVTLAGRVLPGTGPATAVKVCVPGLVRCVEALPDSTWKLNDAPVGAYEVVFLSPGLAHYLAIQVDTSAAGTVYLRDVALPSAADADHVPFAFYDLGRSATFSAVPVRYALNASPAWYQGKDFDKVQYYLLTEGKGPVAWNPDYFTAWAHRLPLAGDQLAPGTLTAPLPGFPVPVRLSAPAFDFSQAKSGGADLVVSDGAGRILPHQIERWDSAGGKAVIWIRMESLAAATADRKAVLHWGRDSGSAPTVGRVFRREDGFIGAWHLSEQGNDSAVGEALSRYAGRLRGTVPAGGRAGLRGDGILAGGYRFGASRNWIHVPFDATLDVQRSFTVSVWARINNLDSVKQIFASKWMVNKREWHFHMLPGRSLEIEFGDSLGQIQGAWRTTGPIANVDQWHHYAATFDNGEVKLYVDGEPVAGILSNDVPGFKPGSIPKTISRFQTPMHLGSNTIDHTLDLDGDLDEFWYSPETKSAEWIRMAFRSQQTR